MNEKRHMLIDMATGVRRPALPDAPTLSSASGPWTDVLLEQHPAGREIELNDVATPGHVVVVKLHGPSVLEWGENGRSRTLHFLPGQAMLIPAMCPFSTRTSCTGEIVALSLESTFVRCAAHDLFTGPEHLELKPMVPLEDPLLQALSMSMKREAEAGYPGGRAYGEALATALAAHLVRHYSTSRSVARADGRGLSRHQLRRALDFMQAHLGEDISLAALATEAGLSMFHFARLFKQSTGLSPHQYLLRCRVERARELLLSSGQTTSGIAHQVGFCDQSHLTSHFKRFHGLTPMEFRRQLGTR